MSEHLELILEAKQALDDVESDLSVDAETTLDSLLELRGELDIKIEALQESLKSKV